MINFIPFIEKYPSKLLVPLTFTEDRVPSFRVSRYLKSDGRQALEEFTKYLQGQILSLRKKQINERKNTWLYKAERNRIRSTTSMSFDMRKSTARVSPEVNTAFADDETSTSPRQSSLSSFYEFRRKKAQVYPMEERSSPQGYNSQTSLNEQEDSM